MKTNFVLSFFGFLVMALLADSVSAQSLSTFEYDALGRLKKAQYGPGTNAGKDEYTYDAAGNRTLYVSTQASGPQATVYAISNVVVAEGAGTATFTVKRTGTASGVETIDYATASGSATSGTDFTLTTGTLTFQTSDPTKTFTVAITNDTSVETSETFKVNLTNLVGGGAIATASATGTITDNDTGSGNYGIAFDNDSDALVVSGFTGFPTGAFTVDIILKTDNNTTVNGETALSYATSGQINEFRIGADGDTDLLAWLDGSSESLTLSSGAPPYDGSRHRITISVDNGGSTRNLEYYVDGVSVGSDHALGVTLGASGALVIGQHQSAMGTPSTSSATAFKGEIYRVRIWNRELSGSEVSAGTTTSGLVADFDFLEGSGATTASAVGSYSAAFSGTPTWVPDSSSGGGSTSVYSIANAQANEGGTITFTVSRTGTAAGVETIQYATSSGTATSGTDFTAASGTLTFQTSDTSKTFTVSTTQDSSVEGNETLSTTLSSASAGTIGTATATGTIIDDDSTGTSYSIADSSVTEGGSITFTVTRTGTPSGVETIEYQSYANTADGPGDYPITSGTLTFQTSDTSKTITMTTVQDSLNEGTETFYMRIRNASAGTIVDNEAIGTINDDDGGSATVYSIANAQANEGGTVTFTVSRTGTASGVQTIQYATSSGTATSGTDFTSASGTLTFQVSDTSKTFTVSTTQDSSVEGNETFTATLSSASAGTIGTATATGTIIDDDSSGGTVYSIANASATESNGNPITFTVSRTGTATGVETIQYATSSGTATAGSDFTSASGTLTFQVSDTSKTINVIMGGDAVYEATETFTVTLSSASAGTIGTATATGTINDNDTAPAFAISNAQATEGGTVTFTVTKTGTTSLTHAVNYATSSGTATQGTDYTGATGTLNFGTSETSKTFTVSTTDDSAAESGETFTVTLSSATAGATISTATATGTINDNDSSSNTAYTFSNASANEGSTITFTVTRTGTATGVETIDYATSSGTATSGTDFTAASGTLTFQTSDTSKTFTVSTTQDTSYESNETFTVTLSNLVGGGSITNATRTGTINNNDTAPSFAIGDTSTGEAGQLTFTVTKTGSTGLSHNVSYATSSGTATSGTDFTAASGTLTFTSGQTSRTFTVNTTYDELNEADETVNATISSATNGASISDSSGVGTIVEVIVCYDFMGSNICYPKP